ncbi:hypothetical protein Tco_1466282 [Tanacetum coccineum]
MMAVAYADLGARINLMPLSVWKQLYSRNTLQPRMIVKHSNSADRDSTVHKYPKGVAKDVLVKVGKFYLFCRLPLLFDLRYVACEEYAQEVLGFFRLVSSSGNPTPSNPIIASSSPVVSLPFEGGYFILEEIDTFLHTPDELSNLDDDYYDTEGDILYLEKMLNEDPSPTLPPIRMTTLSKLIYFD